MTHTEERIDIGLGDRVEFKAKGLCGVETTNTGYVHAMFLNGKIKIQTDEGLVYTVHKSEVELLWKAA